MKYRLVSRDTRTMDWEKSEHILSEEELDQALHNLIRTSVICNLNHGEAPVFLRELGPGEMLFISFEEER